jgi:hypothetical protein
MDQTTEQGLQQSRTNGDATVAASAQVAAGTVVYDHTWAARVLGVNVSLELRIVLLGEQFTFQVTAAIAGHAPVSKSFSVNGDTSVEIPIYIGTAIVSVSGWTFSASTLSFDLAISVAPLLGLPRILVVNQRIVIPLPRAQELAALTVASTQSAAEYQARVQLLALSGGQDTSALLMGPATSRTADAMLSPAAVSLPPGVIELCSGYWPFGINTRDNPVIDPSMPPPQGSNFERGGVRWGNPDVYILAGGDGDAHFIQWIAPGDPRDLRFQFHVGSPLFGGGGTVVWTIYGTPNPASALKARD